MREGSDTFGSVLRQIYMDDAKFDQIVDVEVSQDPSGEKDYFCLMACLVKG